MKFLCSQKNWQDSFSEHSVIAFKPCDHHCQKQKSQTSSLPVYNSKAHKFIYFKIETSPLYILLSRPALSNRNIIQVTNIKFCISHIKKQKETDEIGNTFI